MVRSALLTFLLLGCDEAPRGGPRDGGARGARSPAEPATPPGAGARGGGGGGRRPTRSNDERCPDGFYPLTKSRGFVCAGKGIVVGRYPRSIRLGAHPANLEAPVPYQYGYVRRDGTPLYRRMPTYAQVQRIEAPAEAAPDAGVDLLADGGARGPRSPAEPATEPGEGEPGARSQTTEPQEQPEQPDREEDDEEEDEEDDPIVLRRMKKGFMLSIDRNAGEWPNLLLRTIRGQFVNARRIHFMRPTTFQGVALGHGEDLPAAFASGRARVRYQRHEKSGRVVPRGQVDRNYGFRVAAESDVGRLHYLEAPDGSLYRSVGFTVIRSAPLPEGVGPDEKWIDVDLASQTLVAYEGPRAVYATLVSSGSESHDHATPPGKFRIRSKHVTFTMDGDLEGDGAYSIEDVPYVMYYDLSYALHAAFWHSYYGRQRSHGCVNLSAADAKWLFAWVDPALPDGWYGVWADDDHPGTRVFIH